LRRFLERVSWVLVQRLRPVAVGGDKMIRDANP